MILAVAEQLLPQLLPRSNGQGIFSIFNPESHVFGPKEKKSIRTRVSPQNFIQEGIANILQINPFTNDNHRRGFNCTQGFRGPQQQNKQVYVEVQNPDVVQKIMPIGHQICQLFASALTNLSTQQPQARDLKLTTGNQAMQVFLDKTTEISGKSQRIIETSQELPVINGAVPVFNGINVKGLTSTLVSLNPPKICISNSNPTTVELAQSSYIGSIVWLNSIPITVNQSCQRKIKLFT